MARTGGYIAGRHDLVEKCAFRLTTPGLGREVGATLGMNRELYMGLFYAPHTVGEALKSAVYIAALKTRTVWLHFARGCKAVALLTALCCRSRGICPAMTARW